MIAGVITPITHCRRRDQGERSDHARDHGHDLCPTCMSDAAEQLNSYSQQPSTLNNFCPKILILLLYKINSNLKGSFRLLLKLT